MKSTDQILFLDTNSILYSHGAQYQGGTAQPISVPNLCEITFPIEIHSYVLIGFDWLHIVHWYLF